MSGKLVAGAIVVISLMAGVAIYYLQIYAFYDKVAVHGSEDVMLTPFGATKAEPILYENFQAIDADSSPIRYRACFTTPQSIAMLTETYEPYEGAEPRVAPGWFDCFDAKAIGAALERGEALAFLGQRNVTYGVDRVVAILPDGRGFTWHQINHCGEEVFDGKPVPADCPPRDEN
ncbi:MAG: histidine kinase [Rhodobacterales bacterium]|nr:MAG: histidine kinase [Rhodobacterales bacterium]